MSRSPLSAIGWATHPLPRFRGLRFGVNLQDIGVIMLVIDYDEEDKALFEGYDRHCERTEEEISKYQDVLLDALSMVVQCYPKE